MSNPSAAILVIGDEILSGRTRDSNLHYLSCELTKIGIDLQEARLVQDKAAEIVGEWTYTKEVRCVGNQKDQYGTLMANCFVSGYNLNARIVSEGLGLAYRKYSEQYIPEEDQARKARKGLWEGEFIAPWDWRTGKRLN